jgi:CYTH domain-containing protein
MHKYARIERERRFLLQELPEGLTRASRHVQIWDNYITRTRLRLRRMRVPETKGQTWKLTQKYAPDPQDFSHTVITNIYLSPYEYEVLSVFEGNELRKNRYRFEAEDRAFAIDVFLGALWGLILAETEFETDEEMRALALPSFAVAEVTNDEMFTGARLVEMTFDEIQKHWQQRSDSSNPKSN